MLGIFGKHYNKWFIEFEQKQVVQSTEHDSEDRLKEVHATGEDDEVDGAVRLREGQLKNKWRVESKDRVSHCVTGRFVVS